MSSTKWLTVFREPQWSADEGFAHAVALADDPVAERIVMDRRLLYPGLGDGRDTTITGLLHVFHEPGAELPALLRRLGEQGVALYAIDERRTTFTDPSRRPLAEEPDGLWILGFMHRLAGTTPAQFDEHWRTGHLQMVAAHHPGTAHYRQNAVQARVTPAAPALDGIFEAYHPTYLDVRDRTNDSPEGAAAVAADLATFSDQSRTEFVYVQRTTIR